MSPDRKIQFVVPEPREPRGSEDPPRAPIKPRGVQAAAADTENCGRFPSPYPNNIPGVSDSEGIGKTLRKLSKTRL